MTTAHGRAARPAAEQLRRILEHEARTGCRDDAVYGGLDELLREFAAAAPLAKSLPPGGYRQGLDAAGRADWIKNAIASLNHRRRPRTETTPAANASPPAPETPPAATSAPALSGHPDRIPITAAWRFRRGKGQSGDLPKAVQGLEKLGVSTVGDLLRHYPFRHVDWTTIVPIRHIADGMECAVAGVVKSAGSMGRHNSRAVVVGDDGGEMDAVWFNHPWLYTRLKRGARVTLAGKVKNWRGSLGMTNPEVDIEGAKPSQRRTGRLLPVYSANREMPEKRLSAMIAEALDRFGGAVPEPLPSGLRERRRLLPIATALRGIHFPDGIPHRVAAARSIAFADMTAVQIGVLRRRAARVASSAAPPLNGPEAARTAGAFTARLPFALTGAQERALAAVMDGIGKRQPMERLLQGDVGSGKTVVALAAMLACVASGRQAVLMAPTEVLAEQHYRTICDLLSRGDGWSALGAVQLPYLPYGKVEIALLTGSSGASARRRARNVIRSGEPCIAVGTHALIQRGIEFGAPGLAVVDEQHRFGVMQRAALRSAVSGSGAEPHLLVMTATPIPRSLALTVFGDLDLSTLDEMPPGRTPPATRWLKPADRGQAFEHVRNEVADGRQAFVICPLIEESEAISSRAATEERERLRATEFAGFADRVGLLHGRMPGREKDAAMRAFASGETAVLVSTAVVEVGIDVPNATVMVIEGADRFGLAQLHQFRGRVGRGEHPSACFLLADDPSEVAAKRLALVEHKNDGFALAQADLEMRGHGELFGVRQSGPSPVRFVSLLDGKLIAETREEAEGILREDPYLDRPEHAALRDLAARAESGIVAEAH